MAVGSREDFVAFRWCVYVLPSPLSSLRSLSYICMFFRFCSCSDWHESSDRCVEKWGEGVRFFGFSEYEVRSVYALHFHLIGEVGMSSFVS